MQIVYSDYASYLSYFIKATKKVMHYSMLYIKIKSFGKNYYLMFWQGINHNDKQIQLQLMKMRIFAKDKNSSVNLT